MLLGVLGVVITSCLLIDMGFTALAIAERVGHESIDITYRYAHLFPTRQVEMADKLDSLKNEKGV